MTRMLHKAMAIFFAAMAIVMIVLGLPIELAWFAIIVSTMYAISSAHLKD